MGRAVVSAVFGALAVLLAAAVTQGRAVGLLALALAVGIAALAVLGRERTATLCMAIAFATAPFYRGILGDLPATPTDLMLLLSVLLLLPELFSRQIRIPTPFLLALLALVALGLRAAAVNAEPVGSILLLAQWMLSLAILPIVIALWQPSSKVIQLLCWSYLAGHAASILKAVVEGPLVNDRYDGLTHHPNAFGIAGVVSIAIVFYLWPKHRHFWYRAALAVVTLASGASILMSGSRAATVVVIALAILVPVVERSAILGLLLAAVAGLSMAFLPYVVDASGEGSSISRLAGDSTSEFSDSLREDAIDDGQRMFEQAPFFGSGLSVELGEIHNLYLEVAIAVGMAGVVAFAVLLFVLARSLVGSHPERRLSYFAWVFIIIGPAVPGLADRTMLVPMGLAIIPALGAAALRRSEDAAAPEPARTAA